MRSISKRKIYISFTGRGKTPRRKNNHSLNPDMLKSFLCKPDVVVSTCNPSTQEDCEFHVSLGLI
jgi:hypothetical protein